MEIIIEKKNLTNSETDKHEHKGTEKKIQKKQTAKYI